MTPEQLTEQVQTVLNQLLPDQPDRTTSSLTAAGRIISDEYNAHHQRDHARAQRGGAIVWALRQQGMSWRDIYDATGIIQRSGARWMDLFVQEGIAERSAEELKRRLQGGDPE